MEIRFNNKNRQTFMIAKYLISATLKEKEFSKEMRYIHVEGDYIVSTDGNRLHVIQKQHLDRVTAEDFEDGNYEVLTNTIGEIVLSKSTELLGYPEFMSFIPEKLTRHDFEDANSKDMISYVMCKIARQINNTILHSYIKDACILTPVDFCTSGDDSPIVLYNEFGFSVINIQG